MVNDIDYTKYGWKASDDKPKKASSPISNDIDYSQYGYQEENGDKESTAASLIKALPRIGKDLVNAGIGAVRAAPDAARKGWDEITGIGGTAIHHPGHLAKQAILGGGSDLLSGIINALHDANEYSTKRLHLKDGASRLLGVPGIAVPHNESIKKWADENVGEPEYPGEALMRGLVRHLPDIAGASGAVKGLGGLAKRGVAKYLEPVNEAKSLERNASDLMRESVSHKESLPSLSSEISEYLGKGAKNTEQVSSDIANDVRKLHDASEANAGIYFNHVLDQAGHELIYKKADPLISTALDEGKALISSIDDLNVGDLFNNFKKKPTFANAHKLQSELGVAIGDLKKIPGKTPDQNLQLSKIVKARDQLKADMMNHLENNHANKNVNLAPAWQKGIDIYREEVEPFLSNKKLREINKGRKNYVKNIHEAFQNPDAGDLIERSGNIKKGSGSKLLEFLPQDTKDKILFSKIGAYSGDSHKKLISAIDLAKRKGYSKYISSDLENKIGHILDKEQKALSLEKESISLQDKIKDLMGEQKNRNKKLRRTIGIPAVMGGIYQGYKGLNNSMNRNNIEGIEE